VTDAIPELSARLDAVFALDPEAHALGVPDGRWFSYAELAGMMSAIDTLLDAAGVGSDAPVAVLLRNRPAHYAATLALLGSRRCLVTVNPSLPDGPLAADLAAVAAAAIIADAQDWARPGVADAAAEQGVLAITIGDSAQALGASVLFPPKQPRAPVPDQPGTAVEMLTSGTTGTPKRIKLARDSLSRSLWAGSKYEAGTAGELALKRTPAIQWMPLAHIGGLFGAVYQTYNGRPFVLMERFQVDEWHGLILRHRPRFVNVPPSALYMVLERDFPKEDFSSLLALRCGAAPLDHAQALAFERRYGVPVLEGYGATEFAGGVAGWTIRDHRQYAATKRNSVGRANAGVALRVVDRETFEPLGSGQHGLLEVRSGQIGNAGEWVRTSDLASLDDDGFLYIHGRADSAIIRGGFKIMPDKVEQALLAEPAVREACVIGVPDERLGQVPVAAVVLHPGSAWDAEAIRARLRDRLKPYEVPVEIRALDALPRTPSLKVSQAALRDLFAG
jgi:long-chain acyl-CoA synthetase